jgi:ABC-type sugar transport system ATPase subunit
LAERKMRDQYTQLCARVGVSSHPDVKAGELSVAEQQMLEILRALHADAKVILYDEPTASLSPTERDALLRVMNTQRQQGLTQVFVTHNLDDVLAIADRITVFRNGQIVGNFDAGHVDKEMLVHAMLGRQLEEGLRKVAHAGAIPSSNDEPSAISVSGLKVPGIVEDLDLYVQPGEILGIAGLVGSGRTTVLRALSGLESRASGQMTTGGRNLPMPRSPRRAADQGVGLAPEDRKGSGLCMNLTALDNIVLGSLAEFARLSWVRVGQTRDAAREMAIRFGLDPMRLNDPVRNLSGGNQQKVLLARLALAKPKILLVDEPTRGIDVGAKAEILRHLEEAAANGMAIIFVSSELEEVLAIAHRVLVLNAGKAAATLDNYEKTLTTADLLSAAFGVQSGPDHSPSGVPVARGF